MSDDMEFVPNRTMPAEGENGVFTQSWFPVALAADLPKDKVLGCNFLDGRIVLFRDADGRVAALSAYCPHVGADLSVGCVVEGHIQCAFHRWEYDAAGRCTKTGIADPPPRSARLFVFPVRERFGIIWVFNGTEPLFELPDFPHADEELVFLPYATPAPLNCDPWVFAANTPDMQHLKAVHLMQFEVDDPHDLVEWNEFGLKFTYAARHQGNVPMRNTACIFGTSIFFRYGTYGDFWRGTITGFGLPSPGTMRVFGCHAVLRGPQAAEQLETVMTVSRRTIAEDRDILNTIHFRQGVLTKADRTLGRFLAYVRRYPRAHPSASFIN